MACRNMDKCGTAVEELKKDQNVGADKVYPMKLNLASFKSIREFASDFKASKLLSKDQIFFSQAPSFGIIFHGHSNISHKAGC